jgi:hypothetical protein
VREGGGTVIPEPKPLRRFTTEEKNRIVEALSKKIPDLPPCQFCGVQQWMLGDAFIFVVLQDNMNEIRTFGSGLPLIHLLCRNCGNIALFSAMILGLRDLIESVSHSLE